MTLYELEKAIEIFKRAYINAGGPAEEAFATALECMEAMVKAPVKWYKLDDDGKVAYQTTPKGHGRKGLCKIVVIEDSPEICPCCGLPKVRDVK